MRRIVTSAVLVFIGVEGLHRLSFAATTISAIEKTLQVDGRERHSLAFVPANTNEPMPLVIALHGGGGSARQMERITGFDDFAQEHGFIVIYPNSLGGYWNDGRGVEFMRAQKENIDDVKFIRSLIDDVAKDRKIDRHRVFATGFSNGGFMAHRLAAEASDVIAGIAPVVGGMAPSVAGKFKPQFPVSILIIQGDSDRVVPIGGGDVVGRDSTRGKVIATKLALSKYVELNGNGGNPVTTKRAMKSQNDKSVEITKYSDGPGGVKAWFCLVKNGTHAWPGRSREARQDGKATHRFSATSAICDFFQNCPPRATLNK